VETLGLHVLNRSFRDFGLFNVDHKHRNFSSSRRASAVSAIGNADVMFSGCSISINDFNFLILSLDKLSFNLRTIFVTNLDTFFTFLPIFLSQEIVLSLQLAL